MKFGIKVKEERIFQGGGSWTKNRTKIVLIKDITTKKEAILILLNFANKVVTALPDEGNWDIETNIPANSNSDIFDIFADSNVYVSKVDDNGDFCSYEYKFILKK